MRKAEVKFHALTAGWLIQDENGYHFKYDKTYLQGEKPEPISLTLPLQQIPVTDKVLFPFFDGLIPEGWLPDIICPIPKIKWKNWLLKSSEVK